MTDSIYETTDSPTRPDNVLDFLPRLEYDIQRWERLAKIETPEPPALTDGTMPVIPATKPSALTSHEHYKALFSKTQETMLALIKFYKQTGWNAECEQKSVNIVRQMQEICQNIATSASTK